MNRIKLLSTFLALIMLTNIAVAETKIGFVKVDVILKDVPQMAASNKKLEKEFKVKTDKLKKSISTLQTKEEEFKKNSITMDEATRETKIKELQGSRIDIQRDERELKEDFDLRRREEINALQTKVNIAIEELAKKEKFDLILYNGVAYASESIDITDQVIKSLSASSK